MSDKGSMLAATRRDTKAIASALLALCLVSCKTRQAAQIDAVPQEAKPKADAKPIPSPWPEFKLPPRKPMPVPWQKTPFCWGECCVFGDGWRAEFDLDAYREKDAWTDVAFEVKKDERVTALEGIVITTKPGRAKLCADLKVMSTVYGETGEVWPRDTIVHLLAPSAKGYYIVWHDGRERHIDLTGLCTRERHIQDCDDCWALELEEPKVTLWIRVRTKSGQEGWVEGEHLFPRIGC